MERVFLNDFEIDCQYTWMKIMKHFVRNLRINIIYALVFMIFKKIQTQYDEFTQTLVKKLEQEIDNEQIWLVQTTPNMIILKKGETGSF